MSSKLIYQFRVTLQGIDPPIWRQVQVPSEYSFWSLHVAIQDSMGWLDYHLHEFRLHKPRGRKVVEIGFPDTESERKVLPAWGVSISEYFAEPGNKAEYEYDFGDGWFHEVLLEGILLRNASADYPMCIAGERACPPEDCGSTSGYERLLRILKLPSHKDYNETVSWLKGHAKNYFPYDPEHFDPAEVSFSNPAKRLRTAVGAHE